VPAALAGPDSALAWLTAERPVLLAAVEQAAATGFDRHACQLALALADFLDRRGYWRDWLATHRTALDAAARLADRGTQARLHRGIGRAYAWLRCPDEARTHFESAMELFGALDDKVGEATTRLNLGGLAGLQGGYRAAIHHAERAGQLFQAAGDRMGQARALNNIGWYHAQLGEHAQTLIYSTQALAVQEELGDRRGQADAWDSLAYAHRHLGDLPQAILCCERAIRLYQELGDRYCEATTLSQLADVQAAAGQRTAARDGWRHALRILDELGHPDADQIRARLDPAAPAR
jgi:tetratricopeptide (TPR) repeat protein